MKTSCKPSILSKATVLLIYFLLDVCIVLQTPIKYTFKGGFISWLRLRSSIYSSVYSGTICVSLATCNTLGLNSFETFQLANSNYIFSKYNSIIYNNKCNITQQMYDNIIHYRQSELSGL